jgi:hypothetical protein
MQTGLWRSTKGSLFPVAFGLLIMRITGNQSANRRLYKIASVQPMASSVSFRRLHRSLLLSTNIQIHCRVQ